METIPIEIENKVEVFDFTIEGCSFKGFTQVDVWESFIKFKNEAGQVIIGFKSLDPVQTAFTEIFGEAACPGQGMVLISASTTILDDITEHKEEK